MAQMLPVFVGYGANIVATPFIVAKLGLENFGLWALTGAVAQYGVLFDFGISRGVIRLVAFYNAKGDEEKERAAVGVSISVILAIGVLLLSASMLASRQLGNLIGIRDEHLVRVLFAASAAVLTSGLLGAVFAGASIGRGRTFAANLGLACQRAGVVVGGLVAIIAVPQHGLHGFAWGSAIGGFVGLVIVITAILVDEHSITIGLPRLDSARELIAFSMKGQVFAVAEIVFFQSGKLILGVAVGPAAAGAYELGSRLALGARTFGTATAAILGAHFTRGYASNGIDQILLDYERLVKRNAAVGNFALFLLASVAFSAVPAWLGFQDLDTTWVAIILAVAYTTNVSTGVTTAVAMSVNRLGGLAINAILGTALTVVLELLLVRTAGIQGVLAVIVLASALGALSGVTVVHLTNDIPLKTFFKPLAGPVILGVISTAIAFPIGIIWNPTDRTAAIAPLFLSAIVFCGIYLYFGWRLNYLPNLEIPSRWRLLNRSASNK